MADDISGQKLGKYTLLEEVGRGGMAVVYKASDEDLGRVVALKVLNAETSADRDATARFEREARLTARLNHPNIIKIFDIGRVGGLVYFAMDFLQHKSLHDTIKAEGKFSVARAVRIVKEVLKGLRCAHDAGVVHRDVKPENIMVDPSDNVILVDFGIAKTKKGARLTQTGILLGTPYYMSPEQITGKEVKATSDIYSTGVVLYELLTANVPFQADSTFMISYMHCTQEPPDPRGFNKDISEELKRVIRKAMAKDPTQRYQTAEEMCLELERIERGEHVVAEDVEEVDVAGHPSLAKGMACYRAQDFEGALRHFGDVVGSAVPPEYAARAQRLIGTCYYDQRRYPEAITEYKGVIDRWPETEEARRIPVFIDGCCFEQLSAGEELYGRGKRQEAVDALRRMLTTLREQEIPLDNNLWSQHAERKVSQMEAEIRQRKFMRAVALAAVGGLVAATVLLTVYFGWINPFASQSLLASFHGARGDHVAEVAALESALELRPEDPRTMFRLARARSLAGEAVGPALELLRRVVALEPTLAEASELAGDLQAGAGSWQDALSAYETALRSGRPSARLLTNLGYVEGRLGHGEKALDRFKQALTLDPDYAMAYNNLGFHHLEAKDYERATAAFRRALAADDRLAPAWHNLGRVAYEKALVAAGADGGGGEAVERLLDEALRDFDQALLIDPNLADALYHKALIAVRRGRWESAREALKRAFETDPHDGRVAFELGQVLLRLDDTREAARMLETAVQLDPDQPRYLEVLAALLVRQGMWDEAETRYAQLVKSVPDNADFYRGKALCERKRNKLSEAAESLAQAIRMAGQSADLLADLGEVLLMQGRAEQAAAILDRAVAAAPSDPRAALLRGDAATAGKDWEAAAGWFGRSAALGGERAEALVRQARSLLQLGRLRAAEDVLRQGLAAEPSHLGCLNELGLLLASQGRGAEAAELLDRSLTQAPYQREAARLRDVRASLQGGGR